MEYKLDLGAWNSVFAVPCNIVDEHLRLAGAAQLKVILWVLRHAGEAFSVEDIASELYMSPADVRDSMLYWKETGVVCDNEGVLKPQKSDETESVPLPETAYEPVKTAEPAPKPDEHKPSRVLSRPEKPDIKYLTERMNADEGVMYLMQTADEIFGRPTSNNEKETLLLIHEYDGLPVEVMIMLLQYASGIGKTNIRYIEKLAITWSDEDITTLERAEEKIRVLTSGRNAAGKILKLFGLDSRAPTEKETRLADKWLNQWNFDTDVIKFAYEICVDSKGKYISGYVDSVLSRWNNSGITTLEQAKADQQGGRKTNRKKPAATYDIDKYESTNAIIEEGF